MKKIASLAAFFSIPLFASTAIVNVPVTGAITAATCILTADTEVDFGSITALNINDNTVPEKGINLSVNCDWTSTNLKLMFVPPEVFTGDDKIMQSGLGGVGFKLPSLGVFSDLSFNTEYTWTSAITNGGVRSLVAKIKPVKIPTEDIVAGDINTHLIMRLSYD